MAIILSIVKDTATASNYNLRVYPFLYTVSYKTKLFINFIALFAVFTSLLVLFQYNRERQYKRDLLESRLQSYADVVAGEMEMPATGLRSEKDSATFAMLRKILPPELRLTVIDFQGRVRYESHAGEVGKMANHLSRPEIQKAKMYSYGSDIRTSETDRHDYFYYAHTYDRFIVRVALPYDATVKDFMKADNVFLWFILMVFPIALVILILITDHFGKAVTGLRNFMRSADRGLVDYDRITFPRSELGDIGRAIMGKYRQIEENNRHIDLERERLMRHFHYFEEGIAIFTPEGSKIYANTRFMQYVNVILDQPTADISAIWAADAFRPAKEFLQLNKGLRPTTEEAPIFRFNIPSGGATFGLQLLVYSDGSFELTLSDITQAEKNKLLKQQMSNNITHELRTPVSSVRGFLETIIECPGLDEKRKQYFLQKAHTQILRLSNLIRDVALITKTEEAAELIPRETVNIEKAIDEAQEDLQDQFDETGIRLFRSIPKGLEVHGNYSLLYSIFRNLLENALKYAGREKEIHINCYNVTPEAVYFSVYDTGNGVPEQDLSRLFERFYRVGEGRTRDKGGTGLGLSIVRNAVHFHGGDISVRNRKEGGLEFLFTLKV